MTRRKVALVGLGRHARRIYYPWLEAAVADGRVELVAVVDTRAAEASVRAYLSERRIQPGRLVLCPASTTGDDRPSPEVAQLLGGLRAAGDLDRLIVSTDPAAHRPYALWALEHDVDVLVDKPLTAPSARCTPGEVAALLRREHAALFEARARSSGRLVVQAQRRVHAGYAWVRDLLARFLAEHKVPISLLDVYHADGVSVMPDEWDREYHPYRFGTGKLLHSGYHLVDLAAWLLELDEPFAGPGARLELDARAVWPPDVLAQNEAGHAALFGAAPPAAPPVAGHGEVDVYLLGQLLAGERVVATLGLQLVQNSFSRRASAAPPADLYKGAGRVRHERVNVQVGSLLNVQVHSLQSSEVRDPRAGPPYGPGHLDHFDVLVFRNSDLVGGRPFEKVEFGRAGAERGHNEEARLTLLEAFVDGRPTGSELEAHRSSLALLAAVYDALEARLRRPPPGAALPWPSRS